MLTWFVVAAQGTNIISVPFKPDLSVAAGKWTNVFAASRPAVTFAKLTVPDVVNCKRILPAASRS